MGAQCCAFGGKSTNDDDNDGDEEHIEQQKDLELGFVDSEDASESTAQRPVINGWTVFWAFIVLLIWMSGWSLVEETVNELAKSYRARMSVYIIMFVFVVAIAGLVAGLVPESTWAAQLH